MSGGMEDANKISENLKKSELKTKVSNSLLDVIIWDYKIKELCDNLASAAIIQMEHENDK